MEVPSHPADVRKYRAKIEASGRITSRPLCAESHVPEVIQHRALLRPARQCLASSLALHTQPLIPPEPDILLWSENNHAGLAARRSPLAPESVPSPSRAAQHARQPQFTNCKRTSARKWRRTKDAGPSRTRPTRVYPTPRSDYSQLSARGCQKRVCDLQAAAASASAVAGCWDGCGGGRGGTGRLVAEGPLLCRGTGRFSARQGAVRAISRSEALPSGP